MGKKKTNGFHLFANSRRTLYEQQSGGRRLSQKTLLEMACSEWKSLPQDEQTAWLSRPKIPLPPAATKTTTPTMIKASSAAAKAAVASTSLAHQKKSHFVEQELFKRTYKTGLDRQTARDEFYGNLLWREKGRLDDLINRRWGIVVLSADGIDVANEVICICVEDGVKKAEMRISRPEARIADAGRLHSLDCQWDIQKPEDINTACIRMNRFIQGCCYNYILVPAHQQVELSGILHQMKATRDKLHDRDTQSIRLDRLICIEDAVMMLRKLKGLPEINQEADSKWEQLTGEWERMSAVEHARSVADYFLSSLEPESVPIFEDDENDENRGGEIRVEYLESSDDEADRLPETWITASPDGLHFSGGNIQAMPRFHRGQLCDEEGLPMPLLTPPDHISPRLKRQPLSHRWRSEHETTTSFDRIVWTRPNPFTYPPQVVRDSQEFIFQSVSRWLENISLADAYPVEEEELREEEGVVVDKNEDMGEEANRVRQF